VLADLAAARPGLAALGAAAAALAGLALVLRALSAGAYPHARLGPGNALTLLRGAGVAALAGLAVALAAGGAWGPEAGWAAAGLAAVLVALDGIDGRAARASGTASAFGARLDVETDLALMAVLAVLAWQSGQAGPWVLALPLFRPAFLLAGRVWPVLAAPLPPRARRSRVAGVQYAGQVAILVPALPPAAAGALAGALVAMVAVSFAVDLALLTRRRAPR
jgi:phosphatidylglycerophosphate synthase